MPPASEGPPARRRDAEENRARIVAAAREVFATAGFAAPLDAIARRAGVGRATLYRNFPDRFALGAAIFEANLVALEALARELRGRADAFMTLLAAIVEQQIEGHALVPALLRGPGVRDLQALALRVMRLLAAPLRRARTAGAIRRDLTPADVLASLAMISAVVADDASVASRRRRATRALDLLIHGLAPRGE
ncbi:MAG: TetR/AcrR family transcriptional regulator [Myxococcales bacterium]|nr:TetR/AcrR family transcriptional regulator [Myxococcales bacterium]